MTQIVATFTVSGVWVAPSDVTSIDSVECWGGGGAGGGQTVAGGGGGGGGGAYAKSTSVSVTAGQPYAVVVGAGGVGGSGNGGAGGDSTFNATTVVADGGEGGGGGSGTTETGGAGGTTAASTGGTKTAGGAGGSTTDAGTDGGGGGGESGGSTTTGNAGGNGTVATGGTGGSGANSNSGAGGNGKGVSQGVGGNGSVPGGGGGGAYSTAASENGGNGAAGQVKITYTTSTPTGTLACVVNSITSPASTGNYQIRGLGFQPKFIIFFFNSKTADGNAAGFADGMGFAVSSADRRAVYGNVNNGAITTQSGHDNTRCIKFINSSATTVADADFVSMDTDGFTINWKTADATARVINFIAVGGSDSTNAKTGQFQLNNSASSQAITGLGFQPDAALFIMGRQTSSAPPADSSTSPPSTMIGFASSSSSRGVTAGLADYTGGAALSKSYQRTVRVFAQLSGAGALEDEADITSFDSGGFTLNVTASDWSPYVHYLAIKGGQFKVGSLLQPGATGNQAITDVGFKPVGIILSSDNAAANTAVVASNEFSLGASSDPTQRGAIWHGQTDTGTPTVDSEALIRTKVITMRTEGASPTTNAEADLYSFDSGGFTLNWTAADATARQVLYFAMGSVSTVQYYSFLPTLGVG